MAASASVAPSSPPTRYEEMHSMRSNRNLLFKGDQLDRSDMRLEGLEVYALIGALQASASLALLADLDGLNMNDDDDWAIMWIEGSLLLVTLAATLGGVYVTMVFAMCSMYGKTALGLLRDDEYVRFMEQTGNLRARGFFAFTATLILFGLEVVLLAGSKVAQVGPFRKIVMAAASVLVLAGWTEMNQLVELASPIYRHKRMRESDGGAP